MSNKKNLGIRVYIFIQCKYVMVKYNIGTCISKYVFIKCILSEIRCNYAGI